MELTYCALKETAAMVISALAEARSARNLLSRRQAEEEREEREADKARRRRARKEERELKDLLRRKIQVKVPKEERPRIGSTTARNLYHRQADILLGSTGLTDARGPDGLYSIHFAFTARGFASTKGRRWRVGEAERAARYIVREDGLERGELGWWSNIAADRNELVAFYRAAEAFERHDRTNANVYISEIIALPAELTARQRRRAVRRICQFFEKRNLPYTVAIHSPDSGGDQRNYHCHIIYSLRPCERLGAFEWSFGVGKVTDINTPDGIKARRIAVVQAINTTLNAAGINKRYTHLSNKARRMAAAQDKVGQQRTWISRRLRTLEARAAQLSELKSALEGSAAKLRHAAARLQRVQVTAIQGVKALSERVNARTTSATAVETLRVRVGERLSAGSTAVSSRGTDPHARVSMAQLRAGTVLQTQTAAINSRSGKPVVASFKELLLGRCAVIAKDRAKSRIRLQECAAAAAETLGQVSNRINRVGNSWGERLRGTFEQSSIARFAEARIRTLAMVGERLDLRSAAARRTTITGLIQLRDRAKARSDINVEARIKLAGLGAIARVREQRRRNVARMDAISAHLQVSLASSERARGFVAASTDRMGEVLAAQRQQTEAKLARISRSPQFTRRRRLSRMSVDLSAGSLGTAVRIGAMREKLHLHLTEYTTLSRRLCSVDANAHAIQDSAVRQQAISVLSERSSAIHVRCLNWERRVAAMAEAATTVLRGCRGSVDDRLNAQKHELERLHQNKASAAFLAGEQVSSTSSPPAPAGPEAFAPNAAAERRIKRRPDTATERLRELIPSRTPETDIHSSILPRGDRHLLPSKQPSGLGAAWALLRGEVRTRQSDVKTELRQKALRRLRVSQAEIIQGANGMFSADHRGLLQEERKVLEDPAHVTEVQAGLAKLWRLQEARRQAAPSTMPPTIQGSDIPVDVQAAFLAQQIGRGK